MGGKAEQIRHKFTSYCRHGRLTQGEAPRRMTRTLQTCEHEFDSVTPLINVVATGLNIHAPVNFLLMYGFCGDNERLS